MFIQFFWPWACCRWWWIGVECRWEWCHVRFNMLDMRVGGSITFGRIRRLAAAIKHPHNSKRLLKFLETDLMSTELEAQ